MKILVIIPTYNERTSLPITLAALREAVPTAEVLIVDDNSPDGTGEWADLAASKDSAVKVMHRSAKNGLGQAYIAGFKWAMERDYTHVVEMDADGSHRAVDLPRLLAAARIRRADVVIGSRWVPGGGIMNWPASRQLISKLGTGYARVMLGLSVRDATAGFRVYSVDALQAMPLDEIESQGYCFQVDMTWRFHQSGAYIVEVPIIFVERALGESKMSKEIVQEALWRITQWGIRHRSSQLKALPYAIFRRS